MRTLIKVYGSISFGKKTLLANRRLSAIGNAVVVADGRALVDKHPSFRLSLSQEFQAIRRAIFLNETFVLFC